MKDTKRSSPDKIPESFSQALIQTIWPSRWRLYYVIAGALLVAVFAVWATLPEDLLRDVLERLDLVRSGVTVDSAPRRPPVDRVISQGEGAGKPDSTTGARAARDAIIGELQAADYLRLLCEARAYMQSGNMSGKEEALNRYRTVVEGLSPTVKRELSQDLLEAAQQAYDQGANDAAAQNYRALFAPYDTQCD